MDEGAAGMLTLPVELTEEVLLSVHARRDLLSLALTCSTLCDIIMPNHLHYHTIAASEFQTSFWAFLVTRPDLARNIRELTLYDHTEARFLLEGRQSLRLPPSLQTDGQDTSLTLYGMAKWTSLEAREFGHTTLTDALRSMSGLKTIDMQVAEFNVLDEADCDHGLVSLVCRTVPIIESFRINSERVSSQRPHTNNAPRLSHTPHPLFAMHALRTLEFQETVMSGNLWPNFCEMLSRLPQLQSLHMPCFKSMSNTAGTLSAEMPFLPCLMRLRVPWSSLDWEISWSVLALLMQEPPITELSWRCTMGLPALEQSFPKLPTLRILQETDSSFVIRFLQGRPAGSVSLRVLDYISFSTSTEPSLLLDALQALESQALRRLHIISLDSMDTLRTISHMFPALEELILPDYCEWMNPSLAPPIAHTVWKAVSLAPFRSAISREDRERMPIHKTLSLFPTLTAIQFVNTGDPSLNRICGGHIRCRSQAPPAESTKTASALRKRYPRLRFVNNWRLGS